jgi:hypothetical protein
MVARAKQTPTLRKSGEGWGTHINLSYRKQEREQLPGKLNIRPRAHVIVSH